MGNNKECMMTTMTVAVYELIDVNQSKPALTQRFDTLSNQNTASINPEDISGTRILYFDESNDLVQQCRILLTPVTPSVLVI